MAARLAWFFLCLASITPAVFSEDDAKKNITGPVIGIDLGTTFSCVAVMRKGTGVEVIPNDQGNRITPSYVAFTKSGRLLGEAAKNEASKHPTQTMFDIKRLIGRQFNDPTVREDMKSLPFKVVEDDDKLKVALSVMGEIKYMTPEEVSAMVLTKMKETAEQFLGVDVKHAVIAVPAYFNNAQREATRDAGAIAGLNVLRIINEPTAAAIAYGLDKKDEVNILVYDLGGGTFDVSLLTVADGVIEVLATNGDTHLGGEDFDLRVAKYLQKLFEEKHGKDISKDKKALSRLRQAAEKAKIALSSVKKTNVDLEGLAEGIDFTETLTRAKFEELNVELFRKTLIPLKKVLEDAKMQKSDVHEVVVVGGSTRIPKIQDMLKSYFFNKEPNKKLNPDEAVAWGAAVQAGVLSGVADESVVLLDINPISVGLETQGGVFEAMIPRNTRIPVEESRIYVTPLPDLEETNIVVLEGERKMVKDNTELGRFKLKGFPLGPAGIDHEVNFTMDVNGILKVSAKILESGKQEEMTITKDNRRLTSEQIAEAIQEAEKYQEEDDRWAEDQQRKQKLEIFISDTEYAMNLLKEKLQDSEVKQVEAALEEARKIKDKPASDKDEEARIPDPNSKMPSDWDDEEDGTWEPAKIDNPALKDLRKILDDLKGKVEPVMEKHHIEGKTRRTSGAMPVPPKDGDEDPNDAEYDPSEELAEADKLAGEPENEPEDHPQEEEKEMEEVETEL